MLQTRVKNRQEDVRCGLSLFLGLGFGAVQHLKELCNAVTHATLHVGLRALDVVVEVVSEELNATDGLPRLVGVGKVAGEEDKGDVADILCSVEPWDVSDLKRRLSQTVNDLWCSLDGRQLSRVGKLLREAVTEISDWGVPG